MTDLTTELRRALDGRWAHIRQELRDDTDPERRNAAARITLYLTRSLLDLNLPEES